MAESCAEIEIANEIIGDSIDGLVPLIETVQGLRAGDQFAAGSGVHAMMFGGGDFSAQLGTKLEWEPLLTARGEFILCCASTGIMAIDVPYIDMGNMAGLEKECRQAKALGFHAKATIHPAQIETVRTIMRLSEDNLAEAR
ncbi:MAG: aldolase/citrate lyase family protein [Pseudomonadota bacterium]